MWIGATRRRLNTRRAPQERTTLLTSLLTPTSKRGLPTRFALLRGQDLLVRNRRLHVGCLQAHLPVGADPLEAQTMTPLRAQHHPVIGCSQCPHHLQQPHSPLHKLCMKGRAVNLTYRVSPLQQAFTGQHVVQSERQHDTTCRSIPDSWLHTVYETCALCFNMVI